MRWLFHTMKSSGIQRTASPPYNPKFKLGGDNATDHLYKVIEKATQPSRGDRFATMQEFADALEGKKPPEAYPRIVADGTSHPLTKERNEWFVGRNSPVDSQADILVNETGARKSLHLEEAGKVGTNWRCLISVAPSRLKRHSSWYR